MHTKIKNSVTFDHLTVNSGHCLRHESFQLAAADAAALEPLTKPGHHSLFPTFAGDPTASLLVTHLTQGHTAFSFYCGMHALVTCHACLDVTESESVWAWLIRAHRDSAVRMTQANFGYSTDLIAMGAMMAPVRRPSGLYLTAHLHPALGVVGRGVAYWLGTFEPCFFWRLWADRQAGLRTFGRS
jgi:hypothetical protein